MSGFESKIIKTMMKTIAKILKFKSDVNNLFAQLSFYPNGSERNRKSILSMRSWA